MRAAAGISRCVLLEEFLFPDELAGLLEYAISREADFQAGTVMANQSEQAVMLEHRRSRLLFDLGPYFSLVTDRMRCCFDSVLEKLGHESFPVLGIDAEISASNDGDFFGPHRDVDEANATRELSYVYYFHREPKSFSGGELRIYEEGSWEHDAIVPGQNFMVLFRASAIHEVSAVRCPSGEFADSRFALNGWIHRDPGPKPANFR
jgi:SM-20-related protein